MGIYIGIAAAVLGGLAVLAWGHVKQGQAQQPAPGGRLSQAEISRRVYRMGWNAIEQYHQDHAGREPAAPAPAPAVVHNPYGYPSIGPRE